MYWHEKSDCGELLDRGIEAFERVLINHSKLNKRVRNFQYLLHVIIENGITHPKIIEAIEKMTLIHCEIHLMVDICNIVQHAK